MITHTMIMRLEHGDTVTARLPEAGRLRLGIGSELAVFIYRHDSPDVFADLCERFGLVEKEVA